MLRREFLEAGLGLSLLSEPEKIVVEEINLSKSLVVSLRKLFEIRLGYIPKIYVQKQTRKTRIVSFCELNSYHSDLLQNHQNCIQNLAHKIVNWIYCTQNQVLTSMTIKEIDVLSNSDKEMFCIFCRINYLFRD